MTVPFLVDPNTGTEMFESDDIVEYMLSTYGPPRAAYDPKASAAGRLPGGHRHAGHAAARPRRLAAAAERAARQRGDAAAAAVGKIVQEQGRTGLCLWSWCLLPLLQTSSEDLCPAGSDAVMQFDCS